MPRFTCSRCTGAEKPSSTILSMDSTVYSAGFICAVNESLAIPFENMLLRSPGIKNNRRVQQQGERNLNRLARCEFSKCRPCVILSSTTIVRGNSVSEPIMNTRVCLMGTFGNGQTPYEQLPRICQHFVIPIRPNPRSAPGGLHIHVSPEMTNPNQYIIGIPIYTKRIIERTWPGPVGDPSSPPMVYTIDQESLVELDEAIQERISQWDGMCRADPGFAVECAVEYRVRCIA